MVGTTRRLREQTIEHIKGLSTEHIERSIQYGYTRPASGHRLLVQGALWDEFYNRVDDDGNDR